MRRQGNMFKGAMVMALAGAMDGRRMILAGGTEQMLIIPHGTQMAGSGLTAITMAWRSAITSMPTAICWQTLPPRTATP